MEFYVGMKLRDLDPRYENRVVEVTVVTPTHVEYQAGARKAKISRARIYAAGSPRKSGYAVVA